MLEAVGLLRESWTGSSLSLLFTMTYAELHCCLFFTWDSLPSQFNLFFTLSIIKASKPVLGKPKETGAMEGLLSRGG